MKLRRGVNISLPVSKEKTGNCCLSGIAEATEILKGAVIFLLHSTLPIASRHLQLTGKIQTGPQEIETDAVPSRNVKHNRLMFQFQCQLARP